MRDIKYVEWSHQQEIVNELKKILGRETESQIFTNDTFSIPMPKRVRKITQLDEDRFTKKIYQGIVKYFEQGLAQLEVHDDGIDIEMTRVTELKFIAKIYVDGDSKSQCKIWMGGILGNAGITYSNGAINIDNDNSFNDCLFLEENEEGLYMKNSGFNIMQDSDKKLQNGQEAGEYFWKSFIQPLER